ncbi:hypothetical protein PV336_15940 [Streptomyces sp. MI02-2A]|uniref:hypothetical protein n=1 Tax=Streptomyces sp. MI02-2A TaxID=3028688 RepID=UPI0029BA5EC0|nr:hypothetical protein [Streptomyces sp. MI02-2A]MDX3260711.1 hypothetical protein [Streptomyces sp. MI02-2A]
MKPITLAFAGNADVDAENIKALLNDLVGLGDEDADGIPEPSEREINLIFPVTRDHLTDGVENVLSWSEYADLPYVAVTDNKRSRAVEDVLSDADEVVHASNVTAGVIDLLKDADSRGEEVRVILLWGEEGGEQAELLLDAAEQAGFKAYDLASGLDDISFGDPEGEQAPEPEPEPEPEKPRRGSRRGRRNAEPEPMEPEEQPLTEDAPEEEKPKRRGRKQETHPVEEDIEQQVNRAAQKAQRETAPVEDKEVDLLLVRTALESAYAAFRLEDERNAVINQADVRERPLTELLRKALNTFGDDPKQPAKAPEKPEESEAEEKADETPRRRRGRPRDESKTYDFLEDEDGNLTRRGRGRIPRGTKVVKLTRAEAEEKGLEIESE